MINRLVIFSLAAVFATGASSAWAFERTAPRGPVQYTEVAVHASGTMQIAGCRTVCAKRVMGVCVATKKLCRPAPGTGGVRG